MDSNRFDDLTKSLAEPHTRRRVVGMLGAALGGLLGGTAVASAAPKETKPSKCYGGGSSCTNGSQCCSGTCTNRRCTAEGPAPQCTVGTDCPGTDSACQKRTCTGGVCGVTNAAKGTAVPDQTKGDCLTSVCDGSGGITYVPDDYDVPPASGQCSLPVCSMGNSYYQPLPQGSPCSENGGSVCDGNGTCIQSGCMSPQDCPGVDTKCQKRACTAGTCGFTYAPKGTPISQQTPGDCQLAICDGVGGVENIPDDSDLPASVSQCSAPVCVIGGFYYKPAPQGTSCAENGGTICDGNGTCIKSQCGTPTDCPGIDTDCQKRTCIAGTCGISFAPKGTPTTTQTPGDCLINICDGNGVVTAIPDDTDAPLYDCAAALCGHGKVAGIVQLPAGTACSVGTCNQYGQCVSG